MSATPVINTLPGLCYFCKLRLFPTRLVNFRVGPTGKRGTYRRRICSNCEPFHQHNIRGPWVAK